MKEKTVFGIGIFLFLAVTLFLTFNRHSKSGYFNYHSEIWGDKAGYYVYLPATLKFGLNPHSFPDSIDSNTGNGFLLDKEKNKVVTKYTYGVALLQLPFYILADVLAQPLGYENNGFSPIYHWCINVAAVLYLTLGLTFLYRFLLMYFDKKSSLITIFSIFLTTNLYYYSIDETGMPHVYSFSLFSTVLYTLKSTSFLAYKGYLKIAAFGLLIGLIILIRPTGLLFLSSIFFLDIKHKSELVTRLKRLFQLKTIFPMICGISLIILPQLLYWNYLNGSPIYYSYQDEGFNWLSPKLFNVWIAPKNGLFLYTPLYLFVIVSLFIMVKNQRLNGFYILTLFLIISYTFSSWWDWAFGCSFGSRSYVEYLSIFSIPIAYGFSKINKLKALKKSLFHLIILVFTVVNLKMSYSYDGCFYGKKEWDWDHYLFFLESLFK